MTSWDGKTIMILCGEPSGDRYAGRLAEAFNRIDPDASISGIGGDHLEKAGVRLIDHIRSLSVSGFTDVLLRLPALMKIRRKIINAIIARPPRVIVMIDFPDFHFSVAKKIKQHFNRKKIQAPVLVYYIPPQIWIWRKRRIRLIKRFFDAVIPVFPFEPELYRKHGIPVFYSGHPIIDFLSHQCQEKTERRPDVPVCITLLPGSRKHEIQAVLPVMLRGIQHYSVTRAVKDKSIRVLIPVMHDTGEKSYQSIVEKHAGKFSNPTISVQFIRDAYHGIRSADIVLCKPGTNNIEIAFFRKPFAVIYRTGNINWLIIRLFVRIRFASLVNIITGKPIVREFLQKNAQPEKIAEEIDYLINDPDYRHQLITELKKFSDSTVFTSEVKVSQKNAEFILSLF